MNKDDLTKGMYDYGRNEALKLRQEAISGSADGTAIIAEVYHTKDPAKAKPYVAPYGTSGLYDKDEVCLWTDGIVYKSLVDNNAYSPADYAANWEKVV